MSTLAQPPQRSQTRMTSQPNFASIRALDGDPFRSPRNDGSQTPPGPEGSNGSSHIVCRGAAGLGCHPNQERCPSGRRSTPGKCVRGNSSRVRIPPSPPNKYGAQRGERRGQSKVPEYILWHFTLTPQAPPTPQAPCSHQFAMARTHASP